jgi:hypothetical protein
MPSPLASIASVRESVAKPDIAAPIAASPGVGTFAASPQVPPVITIDGAL